MTVSATLGSVSSQATNALESFSMIAWSFNQNFWWQRAPYGVVYQRPSYRVTERPVASMLSSHCSFFF